MEKTFEIIDKNAQVYVDKLRDAVAIPSVSGDQEHWPQVFAMADWLESEMKRIGIQTERRQSRLNGVLLPPVILGKYGTSPRTVLVYGHYDVQPALQSDGWDQDPFNLTETNGRLVGRGSSDDKGPVIGWLFALEALIKSNMLNVSMIFCFEGLEESGSEGLDEIIMEESKKYFAAADCVCISDNYWLGTEKPCITFGLRGICYFSLSIQGPKFDLHSGVFGGVVHEPMFDLITLLSKLQKDNKIMIPNIYDSVGEQQKYQIEFNIQDDIKDCLAHKDKQSLLSAKWQLPSLSIHGIQGAFSNAGAKTVIPAQVIGKFSIRLVPHQDPKDIISKVENYIRDEFQKLNSPCKMKIECLHSGKPWVSDTNHWNYEAAKKATRMVYKVDPDLTREGGSIPVTLSFQNALNKNVLLLPMGRADDGAHSVNEKLDKSNYINGIKLLASYLYHVGAQ